jgi:hypothetical protein
MVSMKLPGCSGEQLFFGVISGEHFFRIAARLEEGEDIMTRFQGVRCGQCRQLIATGSAGSGSPIPQEPIHCPRYGQKHSYQEEDRVEFETEDGLPLNPA